MANYAWFMTIQIKLIKVLIFLDYSEGDFESFLAEKEQK
jgi:hypothetical protein